MKQEEIKLTAKEKEVAENIAMKIGVPIEVVSTRLLMAKKFFFNHSARITDDNEVARISLEIIYGNLVPADSVMPISSFIEALVSEEKKQGEGKRVSVDANIVCPYGTFDVKITRSEKKGGVK